MIIDLTGPRTGSGPARLLDMVEGCSKQVFKTWLAERDPAWRDRVEVVAMDGLLPRKREVPPGFKTAASEELPDAVTVMDPFHVVRLAGDALDRCRCRVQQDLHGHRGRAGDPLYPVHRTLHTGTGLLTDKQKTRLDALFADDQHVQVEVTWAAHQAIIGAYREPDPARGRDLMTKVIANLSSGVPNALTELRRLGRTLKKRAADVLAYFDHPRTSTTAPANRSTAASNTSADPPTAPATSPTMSHAACSKPADSDPHYTLDCEEPPNHHYDRHLLEG